MTKNKNKTTNNQNTGKYILKLVAVILIVFKEFCTGKFYKILIIHNY